jgi:hypothetical protein
MILNRFIVILLISSVLGSGMAVARNQRRAATTNESALARSFINPNSQVAEPRQQEIDLTGTYKGTINFPLANMSGEATLTITGPRFKLESGNAQLTGLIVPPRHRLAAISFDTLKSPESDGSEAIPLVISLFFRRTGSSLELRAAGVDAVDFSFTTDRPPAGRSTRRPAAGEEWFVILGSYPKAEINKAKTRREFIRARGYDSQIIDSDQYPNLRDGLWVLVKGPYFKIDAERIRNKMRALVPDAYAKSGW